MKFSSSTIRRFIESNFQFRNNHNGEIRINSIFSQDGKFRLFISPDKGLWKDQKEQTGGEFLSFVCKFLDVSRQEAINILIREYSSFSDISKDVKIIDLVETNVEIPKELVFFGEKKEKGMYEKAAKNYFLNRKINPDGFGYFQKGEFEGRVFIPFYEEGEIVYFMARAYNNSSLRYKNPKGARNDKVFNVDKINEEVVVFEGVFDALSLDKQVGTAILSARITEAQVKKIWDRAPERIILVPDNDETGDKTLEWNLKRFLEFKPVSLNTKLYIYNIPKEFKDFNEMKIKTGKSNIKLNECIEFSRNSVRYFGIK